MSGGIGGPVTGEGVIRDLKRIRATIGAKTKKSPGVQSASLKNDPQFQRSVANGNKWALALKKRMETRQTSRPGISPRGADSRQFGHEAGSAK